MPIFKSNDALDLDVTDLQDKRQRLCSCYHGRAPHCRDGPSSAPLMLDTLWQGSRVAYVAELTESFMNRHG